TNATDPTGRYLLLAENAPPQNYITGKLQEWGYPAFVGQLSSGRFYVHVPDAGKAKWDKDTWDTPYLRAIRDAAFSDTMHLVFDKAGYHSTTEVSSRELADIRAFQKKANGWNGTPESAKDALGKDLALRQAIKGDVDPNAFHILGDEESLSQYLIVDG